MTVAARPSVAIEPFVLYGDAVDEEQTGQHLAVADHGTVPPPGRYEGRARTACGEERAVEILVNEPGSSTGARRLLELHFVDGDRDDEPTVSVSFDAVRPVAASG